MPDGVKWEIVDGQEVRTLTDVDLFEVSVVTFPAYEGTSAEARSSHLSRSLASEYQEPNTIYELRKKDIKDAYALKLKRHHDSLKRRIAWIEKTR